MSESQRNSSTSRLGGHATLHGHIKIARADHWIKNVFVLPGIVVAVSLDRSAANSALWWHILFGLVSICLVTSSNYVINEVLDARFDREHPAKRERPVRPVTSAFR
jgi:4-hydroxybenzoate polyprenyltransferase